MKNQLRSTMIDDWLWSLLIMASEKDISSTIDIVVSHSAKYSDRLPRHLIYNKISRESKVGRP